MKTRLLIFAMYMIVNLIKQNLFLFICLFIYHFLLFFSSPSCDLSVYILHTCNHCSPRLANLLRILLSVKFAIINKQLNSSYANFESGTAMRLSKQSEQEPKRRYDFPCFIRPTITTAPCKSHRQHLGRTADVYKSACQYACFTITERFHSRGRQLLQIYCNKRKFASVQVTGKLANHPYPCLKMYQNFLSCFLVARQQTKIKICYRSCHSNVMTSFGVQKIFILNLTRLSYILLKLYQYLRWLLEEQAPVNDLEKKKKTNKQSQCGEIQVKQAMTSLRHSRSNVKITLLITKFRIYVIKLW